MRLGHIRPFKVMAMTSLRLANLPTKFIFMFTKVYRPIWSLKMRLGNRPCPIVYNVFKSVQSFQSVQIFTKISILLRKHFN